MPPKRKSNSEKTPKAKKLKAIANEKEPNVEDIGEESEHTDAEVSENEDLKEETEWTEYVTKSMTDDVSDEETNIKDISDEEWEVFKNPKFALTARPSRSLSNLIDVDPKKGRNYLFYSDEIPSEPNGDFISNIHSKWVGDYGLLESHHSYIQWLFPVFENSGMNWFASKLSKTEAKLMREDLLISTRIIQSYKLMLDFYGLELVDEQTGQVQRCLKNWRARYRNLNTCFHNNLRISRILTSLGELGFSRYKKPLVDHFTEEILENGHLETCARSLFKHWKETLNVDSKGYIEKTLESPEDREESIFF